MNEASRTWRIVVALDFPKREPELVDEHGQFGLPPRLEYHSRVEAQVATINGVRVGLQRWSGEPLPLEITGPLGLNREIVELVMQVEGPPSATEAMGQVDEVAERVIESLSFEMQYAIRPLGTRIIDVTEPVQPGETREFTQLAGYPLAKFLLSAALGHITVSESATLPTSLGDLEPRVGAARGWYVKSLSTPYQADQFIFLWIALEILWAKSDYRTSGPYICPAGHEVLLCPTCDAPTSRPVYGIGIRRFLVEGCGLSEEEASKLWRARQIMHGAVAFDSDEMAEVPIRVQALRAVVVARLKDGLGTEPGSPPIVSPGAVSIDPSQFGVSGTCLVEARDLGWP